jgi:hypothetical protein
MKQYKICLFPTERTLYLFLGEYDKKQVEKACGTGINIDPAWSGAYITTVVGHDIEPLMWIKDPKCKATYIHECVHCVTDIMQATGIKDDEFRAWYTEWLFNTLIDARKVT